MGGGNGQNPGTVEEGERREGGGCCTDSGI